MQVLAGNSPVSDPSVSKPRQLFQAISGTSMASPIVAGMFALLKQAHPDWSPAELRSALMTTADTGVVDDDRTHPAGPLGMGAGMVDPGVVSRRRIGVRPRSRVRRRHDRLPRLPVRCVPWVVIAKNAPDLRRARTPTACRPPPRI